MKTYVARRDRGDANLDHLSTARLIAIANGDDDEAAYVAIELLDRIEDGMSERTMQAYDRIEDRWLLLNAHRGLDPWNGPKEVLAEWLHSLREKHGWPSLQQHIRAIQEAFLRRGHPDPTADPLVRRTIAALRVNAGGTHRGQEALLVEDYLRLRATIPAETLGDHRDRVAIGSGFHGMLTVAEICDLDVPDVEFVTAGLVLHVRRHRGVRRVEIPRVAGDEVVADVRAWIERAGLSDGPFMREVRHDGVVTGHRLSRKALPLVLKRRLRAAGMDARRYSWGSLRDGFLASAHLRGVDEVELAMRAGYRGLRSLRGRLAEINAHGRPLLDTPKT